MKISWGVKIGILYLGFIALIAVLVTLSMNQKVELESADYYAKELKFQDKINATQNANISNENIEFKQEANCLEFSINKNQMDSKITGEILFYKASNANDDKKITISFDIDGKQIVPTKDFAKGVYSLQLSWSKNNTNFYKEAQITIK